MAEVYCTSLCLQIKLFGGATLVNWRSMSLLGFAVDSLFRPIGHTFPEVRFFNAVTAGGSVKFLPAV